jgi:hypothetical protein
MRNCGTFRMVVGSELGRNAGLSSQRLFARLRGLSMQILGWKFKIVHGFLFTHYFQLFSHWTQCGLCSWEGTLSELSKKQISWKSDENFMKSWEIKLVRLSVNPMIRSIFQATLWIPLLAHPVFKTLVRNSMKLAPNFLNLFRKPNKLAFNFLSLFRKLMRHNS